MSSPRRKAREAALKALYQQDLVKIDAQEAIDQVLSETVYRPVFQAVASEFLKSSKAKEVLSGEVENFIPDFSGKFSAFPLPKKDNLALDIKDSLEKHFDGITYNPNASQEIKNLIKKVQEKYKNLEPIESFAREIVLKTDEYKKSIDSTLAKVAKNWTLDRMASIDRCILRFATCELLHFPNIPINASINEAIELAKKFSADRSFEFVNGILDRIRKEEKPQKELKKSSKKPKQST